MSQLLSSLPTSEVTLRTHCKSQFIKKLSIYFVATLWITLILAVAAIADRQLTMLVFLNGNNNLDPAGHQDIQEMIEGMKNSNDDRVRVLVQWASLKDKKVQRVEITNKGMTVLQDMGKIDMGAVQSLEDFFAWGTAQAPAPKVFLDVWDHGSGWKKKAISHDELTNSIITTEQLTSFLKKTPEHLKGAEFTLGFDACLMGMCDLTSEFSPYVRFMFGSAEVEPAEGWPYNDFLREVNKIKGEIKAEEMGKILTTVYQTFYEANGRVGTLAAMDLQKSADFEVALKKFTDVVLSIKDANNPDMRLLLESMHESLRYSDDEYMDMGDFLAKVVRESKTPELKQAAGDTMTELNHLIMSSTHTSNVPKATGLSIWLPTGTMEFLKEKERYQQLLIHQKTGWGNFIETMVQFQGKNYQMLCDIVLKQRHRLQGQIKPRTSSLPTKKKISK